MDELDGTLNADSSPATDGSDVDASRSSAAQPNDGQGGESSPPGVKAPTSIREALARVKPEAAQDSADGDAEGQADGSPLHEKAEAGQAGPNGAAGKKDGQPDAKGKADGSLNVPFAQRPEWKGLIAIAGEKKGEAIKLLRPVFEANQQLTERVKGLQPMADIVGELKTYTGDEEGFAKMRSIVKTYASEPDQAIPILEDMLKDARQRAGLEITSPDLKARLAEIDDKARRGVLDADEAEAWKADLAAAETARATGNRAKATLEQSQTQKQQERQQAEAHARLVSINQWEESIKERDPDFGVVTEPDDPEHGKSIADQVFDGIVLKQIHQPNASTAELVAEANRIYKLARGRLNNGRGRQQRVMTSEGSSITATPAPKTMREALAQVPRERG